VRPNYQKIARLYESHGAATAGTILRHALGYDGEGRRLKERQYRPEDFDLGLMFSEIFGWNEFQACRGGGRLVGEVLEAAGATSSASFASITGQIVYSAIMDAYQKE